MHCLAVHAVTGLIPGVESIRKEWLAESVFSPHLRLNPERIKRLVLFQVSLNGLNDPKILPGVGSAPSRPQDSVLERGFVSQIQAWLPAPTNTAGGPRYRRRKSRKKQ